jgi:capsular polysaccharide transport system permease protein
MATSLVKSLIIQRRVVGALLMREIITRYGRHNIGVLWLVVEPMLFTLGVATLWSLAKAHTITGIPTIAFAITGYSSVLVWRNASSRCARAIEPNLTLMYHRNVKVIDILASRVLLELIGASGSMIVLTLICAFSGLMMWPEDLFLVAGGWVLLCWFALALGLCVGAITERSESLERIWHIITYLLFPLSGAAFMVDWLPSKLQSAAVWVPMVNGTEMMRHGFFGSAVTTHEDPLYFLAVDLGLTLVGLILAWDAGRRVQPE